jgi:hypothetical protein
MGSGVSEIMAHQANIKSENGGDGGGVSENEKLAADEAAASA